MKCFKLELLDLVFERNENMYISTKEIQIIKFGDKAFVKTWVEENTGLKTIYGYHIVNGDGDVCVEGSTTHIIVTKDSFRPIQFKKAFPEWFQKYEDIKRK
ncbi:MAG: ybgC [Bacillales bacterium]|nr:ybgC [Bacillales bacterium]